MHRVERNAVDGGIGNMTQTRSRPIMGRLNIGIKNSIVGTTYDPIVCNAYHFPLYTVISCRNGGEGNSKHLLTLFRMHVN